MMCIRIPGYRSAIAWLGLCCALSGFAGTSRGGDVSIANLVTNDQAVNPAQITDPFLKNAWGISLSPAGPFFVSDNATGVTTLYQINPHTNATTKVTLGSPPDPSGGIVIPPPGSGTPTGQVFNSAGGTGAFNGDTSLFVSNDGTISGWRTALGTTAERFQVGDPSNVYKGVTLNTTGGHSYLLSANFRSGNIDVLKGDSGAPALTGKFTDPNLPANFAPFNLQTSGSRIYVTYALQKPGGLDDQPGAGHGIVSAFDLQGNFLGRIGTMGSLNSPWGLAIAPASFGSLAGDLLVGNHGDGTIDVFSADPAFPAFLGQLTGTDGKPIAIDGLWGLTPGNDELAGSSQDVYFSAGPNGGVNGLFGVLQSIQAIPEPSALVLGLTVAGLLAGRWTWRNHKSRVTD
jgi:uncharacterized protein (TIGR03118 family)